MHVVLLGLTASGKTTLAATLASTLGLPHISAGEIARRLATTDPFTAVELSQGKMAPEEAMRSEIQAALERAELEQGGWILEGFPRDIAQLACLMRWTSALPSFIYLEIEPWTAIERLTARGRPDDTPDAIARRIERWFDKTQMVIETLEGGGVLSTIHNASAIDGATTLDEVLRVLA
jgi:adenylate kinase